MEKKISVIIPVYKVEPYLSACVESVLAQTYSNTEIILVDDGSPDRCPVMCDDFAARDDRIRVIHKENGGLASARNAGIDAAQGEYLAFLDSDDFWSPVFLERMYEAIAQTGANFSVCRFKRFMGEQEPEVPERERTKCFTRQEAFCCLFDDRNEHMVVAPNKLYHRKLFDFVRYPVGRLHEDEAVIHEIIGRADKVAWVDEVHYFYRQTPNSITTAKFNLRRLDETEAKEKRIAYFEEHGMQEFAEQTKRVYLNNLMRLYRAVQHEIDDKQLRMEYCETLHSRFCQIYHKDLLTRASLKTKIRCILFRAFPVAYSRMEYYRLHRIAIE